MADFAISTIIKAVDQFTGPARAIVNRAGSAIGGMLTRVRGLASRAGGSLKNMLNPMTVLAGAGAVGAPLAMVRSYALATDEAAKFARQVGLNINALRQLEFAFDRSGIAPEEFKDGIKELTLRMGQLKAGEGSLLGFVDKVSPAFAEQLKGARDNEEALYLLIKAFRELEDPAARAALADAAFGGAGAKMARIADNSAEQLAELRKQHEQLAGVLDEEAGPQAEAFIDSMTNVKAALGGVKMQLAAGLLPTLTPLLERLSRWVAGNRQLIAQKVEAFIRGIGHALDRIDWDLVLDFVRSFWERLGDVRDVLSQVAQWIDSTFGEGTTRSLLKFGGAAAAIGVGVSYVVGPFGRVLDIGWGLVKMLAPLTASILRAGVAFLMTPAGWITAALMAVGAAVGYVILKWRELTGEANTFTKMSPGLVKRLREDTAFKRRTVEQAMAGNRASQQMLQQAFADEFDAGLWEDVNTQLAQRRRSKMLEEHGLTGGAGGVQDPTAMIAKLQAQMERPSGDAAIELPPAESARGPSLLGQVNELVQRANAQVVPEFQAPPPAASPSMQLPAPQSVEVGGELRVRFEGAPPGMRVEQVRTANPSVPVVANVGRRSMAYGGP